MVEDPKTRPELLARRMEMTILRDQLSPGDSLGTLASWAKETGYSMPTVREAVRITTERGTIIARPGRTGGLFVAENEPVLAATRGLAEVYQNIKHSVGLTTGDLRAVLAALDPLIASEAAMWRTDGNIEDLMDAADAVEAAATPREFHQAAEALLHRVSQITPNAWLTVTYLSHATLALRLDESADDHASPSEGTKSEAQRYRRLVRAIAAGDSATAAAVAATLRPAPPARRRP